MDYVPGYFIPKFFEVSWSGRSHPAKVFNINSQQALTTQHLMYFWVVGLTRIAIVAFLLRMSSDSKSAHLPFRVSFFLTQKFDQGFTNEWYMA